MLNFPLCNPLDIFLLIDPENVAQMDNRRTTEGSNTLIYRDILSEDVYIPTGNDVTNYFRSDANRIIVFIFGYVRVAISR